MSDCLATMFNVSSFLSSGACHFADRLLVYPPIVPTCSLFFLVPEQSSVL